MKTNGTQKLNKKHATVHTATVDVKIMRLDGKQVTLSVFRQLKQESILEWEGGDGEDVYSLKGVPWGLVNYTWEKSPVWADHYLVWQKGDELRSMPLLRKDNYSKVFVVGTESYWGCPRCREERGTDKCRCDRGRARLMNRPDKEHGLSLLFSSLSLDHSFGELYSRMKRYPKDYDAVMECLRQLSFLDQLFIAV